MDSPAAPDLAPAPNRNAEASDRGGSDLAGLGRAPTARWRIILDVVINVFAPAVVFAATHGSVGDVRAMLAAAMPPLLWGLGNFLRHRRLDALSILVLAGLALSVLALAGGGTARVLALREKMVTLLVGLAFLGSAAMGKPLIGPLARAMMARRSTAALSAFEARSGEAAVRRTLMVMTLVWGFGLLADAAVSVLLALSLPIADYLVVGPVIGYGTMIALATWTLRYRRAIRASGARLTSPAAGRAPSPPPGW